MAHESGEIDSRSSVTVALLTLNAGAFLERLLQAVEEQHTSREVEVTAIDSGSTDDTAKILRAHNVRFESIAPDEFDFGRTRDRLFARARSPIVVTLSQDAIPAHSSWLENLVSPLEDPRVAVACGHSIPDPDRAFPQFPWERNGYFYFTREIRKFVARYGRGVSFANAALSRPHWEAIRLDPQPVGEDFQYQTKLAGRDLSAAFPRGAEVLHHHDYTISKLYRRCRDEGLALNIMGCRYREWDLILDLLGPRKYVQWLREATRGRLRSKASWVFPVLRPLAVYAGSRFGRYEATSGQGTRDASSS